MPKGRTAWEILTGKGKSEKPVAIAEAITNPLSAKVGSHVSINGLLADVELTTNELWQITEIWAWERNIHGQKHSLTDYVIESDGKRLVMRVLPRIDAHPNLRHHILIMSQYYPDTPGPMPWNDESPFVLEAADDQTGEFYRFKGEENEEKYWRIGGVIPILCDVQILKDKNQDGTVADHEVAKEPYTLWDFHRVTTDSVGQELTQYLYIQLGGHYNPSTKRVSDGDKTILMLRGEELEPSQVTIF